MSDKQAAAKLFFGLITKGVTVRVIIRDVICDTQTAQRLTSAVVSGTEGRGDVTESLYRTYTNQLFLHTVGGADTDCALDGAAGERITLLTYSKAIRWVRSNLPEDEAWLVLFAWLGVACVLNETVSREIAQRLLSEMETGEKGRAEPISGEFRSFWG